MTRLADLMAEASRLQVSVHLSHLEAPYLGLYDHRTQRVHVCLGLTMVETKEVLAHELAHVFYGDTHSDDRNERRADRRAALLLITPSDYAEAERLDPHPAAIADELGVTEKTVRDFQEYWLRGRGEPPSASSRR